MCFACFLGPAGASAPTSFPSGFQPGGPDPFPTAAAPFPLAGDASLGVTVTWTGVAGFVLERAGTRIAFDPFVSRPGMWATVARRPRVDEAEVARRFAGLDAVFVGHAHYDHAMDLPAVARVSPAARIVGGAVVGELVRRLDVEPRRFELATDGARFRAGPFTVQALASRHGHVPFVRHFDRVELPATGVPKTPFRYPRGEVFAWRVEVGERAIHVHGSAGIDEHVLARQAPADVLVACLAARRGTPRYLDRLAARLTPRVLVPCHHDDFFRPLSEPARPVRTLDWAGFAHEAAALERAHGTRLWLPPRDVACAW